MVYPLHAGLGLSYPNHKFPRCADLLLKSSPNRCMILYTTESSKQSIQALFHRCKYSPHLQWNIRQSLCAPLDQELEVIHIDCSSLGTEELQAIISAAKGVGLLCECELKDRIQSPQDSYKGEFFCSYTKNQGLSPISDQPIHLKA